MNECGWCGAGVMVEGDDCKKWLKGCFRIWLADGGLGCGWRIGVVVALVMCYGRGMIGGREGGRGFDFWVRWLLVSSSSSSSFFSEFSCWIFTFLPAPNPISFLYPRRENVPNLYEVCKCDQMIWFQWRCWLTPLVAPQIALIFGSGGCWIKFAVVLLILPLAAWYVTKPLQSIGIKYDTLFLSPW